MRAAESRFEILKFLNARHFGSHKQAAEFLKFAPELPRNRSKILKFTPKLRNRFGILEFIRTSARLVDTAQNFIPQRGFKILKLICEPLRIPSRVLPRTDKAEAGRAVRLTSQHTHDATEKRHAVKFNHAGGYSNFVRRRIARLRSAAARHGYEVGRAEKLSKFDLMGAVVALIVALAGGLALVVLFTLANTNVSERVREMATLKVLGFFDREVHRYVNREMMILTAMGVVIGLPIGRWVGGLLTAALNMPALYFEVEVKPMSYVIAAAATMAFALLVQLFVNPVLDRIEPVSSLKSVE
ncbi:ABC transporter permease [uncultured Campylobacter sp.]|uniref:ABC transporter permease n=1 Tax=uncultured Campylobacter sp. TaxID=218934 RepID=UPI00260605BE|nr:ABC transporter permease [uncultured Campylobacter sp.]